LELFVEFLVKFLEQTVGAVSFQIKAN